jgi:hypothetical protein
MQSPCVFVTNIGIVTNAQLPLFKVPTGFGGITILNAQVTTLTAGTAGLHLIDAGTAGTTTNGGTLASYGGTAYTAKTPIAMTVGSSPYLAEGKYLAVKEDNTGTTVTVTEVAITYRFGK